MIAGTAYYVLAHYVAACRGAVSERRTVEPKRRPLMVLRTVDRRVFRGTVYARCRDSADVRRLAEALAASYPNYELDIRHVEPWTGDPSGASIRVVEASE